MSTILQSSNGDIPQLSDLPLPPLQLVNPSFSGPRMTPEQMIYFYSPEEWEDFIREWATTLSYVQIKRLGGPNDHGVDVAGFKTERGFEGAWDCFQGKHYDDALRPSDAHPEILKVLHNVVQGYYLLPDQYVFIAPKGCGSTLNRRLSKPAELCSEFVKALDSGGTLTKHLSAEEIQGIRDRAQATDFSLFRSLELPDLIRAHQSTSYHPGRFGTALPARPLIDRPPVEHALVEATYVNKLVDVYRELEPTACSDPSSVIAHPRYGAHLQRQRESFYSAEALRVYARDAVPEGTFEALQEDIYDGVIEVVEARHENGMGRLGAVLNQSVQIELAAHALISVSRLNDRKGICHMLANADRLTWVEHHE